MNPKHKRFPSKNARFIVQYNGPDGFINVANVIKNPFAYVQAKVIRDRLAIATTPRSSAMEPSDAVEFASELLQLALMVQEANHWMNELDLKLSK